MKGLDETDLTSPGSRKEERFADSGGPLANLPLRTDPQEAFSLPLASDQPDRTVAPRAVASLSSRAKAFAADTAAVLLLVAAALLAAIAARGSAPSLRNLSWAAAFALYLSAFATIIPLVLFGRTVGMALTGLSPRERGSSHRLSTRQSAMRWSGTLLTIATLGLPLLWTRSQSEAPTPADRLSGRPLVQDESPGA